MTRLRNPWGQPRFLALITGGYIIWSVLPVLLAIAFAFNNGRSRTTWQGFSFRWFTGETGSGKDLVARAIHLGSPRAEGPYMAINCAAIPDQLLESELFGHVKGSFTGATADRLGLFELAHEGTLLLDEIGDLPLELQAKLLRVLEEGEVRRIGGRESRKVDVRVIAATAKPLDQAVERGEFRADLYYRLNALSLCIPSLRNRIEDVVPLTAHFLERYAIERGNDVRTISPEAIDKLMGYAWPGNVRELESVVTRALTFARAPELQTADIELPRAPGFAAAPTESLRDAKNQAIVTFERRYVASLLARYRGNVTHAAKAAGTERRSFQRLLRKHNLDRHSFRV